MPEEKQVSFDINKVKQYIKDNKKPLKLVCTLLFLMLVTAHIKSCIRANQKEPVYPRIIQTGLSFRKDVPEYVDSFLNFWDYKVAHILN